MSTVTFVTIMSITADAVCRVHMGDFILGLK